MTETADKRSVSTDALATLGTIITGDAARDAIHLAVEPVVAGETLYAGRDIAKGEDGRYYEVYDDAPGFKRRNLKPVGIVDPFVKDDIQKGQRFWLIVYPRQITSLRHVWEHPDFPDESVDKRVKRVTDRLRGSHEQWLREFAATVPVHYEDLMQHAADWVRNGEYWSEGGRFEGYQIPAEFWDHYDDVLRTKVPVAKRGNFFTCAC